MAEDKNLFYKYLNACLENEVLHLISFYINNNNHLQRTHV
jgi:hypothetical protein